MIDQRTFERFADTQRQARRLGVPLIEALEHKRLLLTPELEHEIRVSVLEELSRRLDLQAAHKLMSYYIGRPDGTSHEMFEAVKQWIDTVIGQMADKTLEDL